MAHPGGRSSLKTVEGNPLREVGKRKRKGVSGKEIGERRVGFYERSETLNPSCKMTGKRRTLGEDIVKTTGINVEETSFIFKSSLFIDP